MEIRLATIDDAQAIYAIEQQSFSVPWSLESVLGLYTMKVKSRISLLFLPHEVRDMDQNLPSN